MIKLLRGDQKSTIKHGTIDHPQLAHYCGNVAFEQAAEEAKRQGWQAVERLLKSQPDPQERFEMLIAVVDETPGRPAWIDQWVQARPEDYLALLFSGWDEVSYAWEARGGARFKDTPPEAFRLFQERLEKARPWLEAAADLSPEDDAGAWVAMLTLARGLQYPKEYKREIYEQVQEIWPASTPAILAMIQNLAPKWHEGSIEEMFEVARDAEDAPDGSSAHVAILNAHFEAWMESDVSEYWKQPEVVEDVRHAAARSIESAAYTWHLRSLWDHSWFLWAYAAQENWAKALPELVAVDGRLAGPWRALEKPFDVYARVARAARKSGGRG